MKHFFLYYAIPTVLCFSSTRKGYIFPFFTLFLISAISYPCLAYDKQYPDFEVEKGSYRTLASLSDVYEYQGGYLGDTYNTFTITIIPNWSQEFNVDIDNESCAIYTSECTGSNLVTCVDGISNPAANKNANIDYPACYYGSSERSFTIYWPDVQISCLDAAHPTNGIDYCRFFIGITYDLKRQKKKAGARERNSGSTSTSRSRSRGRKKKIVLWWSSPHSSFGDTSSYYNRLATALENQPEIILCQHALVDCYKTAKEIKLKRYLEGIPLLIGIPHLPTSELNTMIAEISRIETELEQLTDYLDLTVNTEGCAKIMFCLFLNKIYKSMDQKVASFTSLTTSYEKKYSCFDKVVFTWSPHAAEFSSKYGIQFYFLPFAIDPLIWHKESSDHEWGKKDCDVYLQWDTNEEKYEMRKDIQDKLLSDGFREAHPDIKIFHPSVPLSYEKYASILPKCHMIVTTVGMPGRYDLVGTRFFEVMSQGSSLLLTNAVDRNSKAYNELRIRNGLNVVMFSSLVDLIEKIYFYKERPEAAAKIMEEAQKWSADHTWTLRAQRIVYILLSKCKKQKYFGFTSKVTSKKLSLPS